MSRYVGMHIASGISRAEQVKDLDIRAAPIF